MSKNSLKWRYFALLAALLFIVSVTYVLVRLAQGYRLNLEEKSFAPSGLLSTKSTPDSAQVWIDGKLKTATDNTVNLAPGQYQVEIKKIGYTTWSKKLTIEKELVTTADAHLFSTFPSLRALTFTGAQNPVLSPDGQKIVFGVASDSATPKSLWVVDLTDRPLGFSREPRQIIKNNVDGRDFSAGKYTWSPDSKQVLVTLHEKSSSSKNATLERNFLLDTDKITPESQIIDLGSELKTILQRWENETQIRLKEQNNKLPAKLFEAIDGKVTDITFSPDETKIMYTASQAATIPDEIIPPLPSTNSQPEHRQIEPGKVYVYDLKEDKNFLVSEAAKSSKTAPEYLSWFPTSQHIFMIDQGKIFVMEYDSTNKMAVYSGDFSDSFAAPFPDSNRIVVLTSIGKDSPTNLYAISIR